MYAGGVTDEIEYLEPGGREPAPSTALHRLQDFVNTNDLEGGEDALGTRKQLRDWLVAAGALRAGARVSAEDHARALAVREGLRAMGRANNGEPLDATLVAAMNAAAAHLPLVANLADAETWRLAPAGRGVDAFLASLLGTLVAAIADGSWSRVKSCRNDTCRWLFYDQSRNRSGTWCTMAICGSRMKARAYRARQRSVATTSA